ncbi:hypothetical protein SPFM20_00201 [Salmonella phage SPFM20]|nr:hypothetical protein SPFM20_00201 [Salmonella phage SPFM20]
MAASKTLIQLAKRFTGRDFFDLVYDDDSRQDNITMMAKTMIKSFYTRNWLRKQGIETTDDIAAQLQQEGISMDPNDLQMELFDKRTEFFEKLADLVVAFINGMKVTLPPPDTSAAASANGNGMTTDQITKKVSEYLAMLASPSLQSAMIKIIAEYINQVVKKQEILSKPLTRYVVNGTPENIEFASQIFSKSLLVTQDEGLLRRTCHIAGVDPDLVMSTKVSVSDTTPDYKYPDKDFWAMTTNAGIAFNVIGNDYYGTDIMNSYNRRQPMWGDMNDTYDIELAPDDMNGQKTIDQLKMALLFATMNSAVLNSARHMQDEDGIGVSITERSFVISTVRRHTQVIYIPAENLCYFATDFISMTVTETFSRIMLARHLAKGEIAEDQLTKALGEALGGAEGMGNTTRITPDIANRLTARYFMNYLNNDGMVDSTINRANLIVDEMGNFINSRSTLYGDANESTLPLVIGDDVRNPIGYLAPKMSFSDANKIEYTERLLPAIGDLNEAYQKTPEQKLYGEVYNADQFTDSEQEKAKLGLINFGQLEQYAYEQPSTPTGASEITLLPEAYRRVAQENARTGLPFKADGMLASLDIVITDNPRADKPTKPQTIKLNFAAAPNSIGGENKPKVGVESILGRARGESLRRSQSDFFERQLGILGKLLISDTGFDELFGLKPSVATPNKLYQWIYDALKSKGASPVDLRQQLLEPVREFHDHTRQLSTKDLINTTLIYDNVADIPIIFDALPELEVIVTIATSSLLRTELTGIASSRIRTVKNAERTSPSAQQQRGKREDGGVTPTMEDISKLTGDPAVAAILRKSISLTG